MSASVCCSILLCELPAPSSFSTSPLRPLNCISSAKTRSAASDGMKSTFDTRASASSARSISAAKTEPLAPVTASVSFRLDTTVIIAQRAGLRRAGIEDGGLSLALDDLRRLCDPRLGLRRHLRGHACGRCRTSPRRDHRPPAPQRPTTPAPHTPTQPNRSTDEYPLLSLAVADCAD